MRDIPHSQVLTLRWIMRPLGPSEPIDGPRVDVSTIVRDVVPVLAGSERPVFAVEGDEVVGVVDREVVLRAIAEEGG